MRIRNLPAPVTASKADWLPGTTWIGFTPQGQGPDAASRCQSSVQRQFGNGYVLERITQTFEEPNEAFAADTGIVEERERHAKLKDRLIAVHRLRSSAKPLAEIIGQSEFEHLQDVWASGGNRRRWSVAFPIIETYHIVEKPRAREIFNEEVFCRLYQYQSAILRPLDDEARAQIADLDIKPLSAPNAWIAIEDEFAMAEASEISREALRAIERDLAGALEGEPEERRSRIKKRAAWLADRFATERRRAGHLVCDDCGFDPRSLADLQGIRARSCFDVHHLSPLNEGKRYTTTGDFALLCPTCHRMAHLRSAAERRNVLAAGL